MFSVATGEAAGGLGDGDVWGAQRAILVLAAEIKNGKVQGRENHVQDSGSLRHTASGYGGAPTTSATVGGYGHPPKSSDEIISVPPAHSQPPPRQGFPPTGSSRSPSLGQPGDFSQDVRSPQASSFRPQDQVLLLFQHTVKRHTDQRTPGPQNAGYRGAARSSRSHRPAIEGALAFKFRKNYFSQQRNSSLHHVIESTRLCPSLSRLPRYFRSM